MKPSHRSSCRLLAAALTLFAIFTPPARAVTPDEMLRDPALEGRARALGKELRCVVCQNQSIDDSNAPLAHDLRVLLRERLSAGDNDKQAIAYIVARYGNFVLLEPPMQTNTILLWGGPALFLLVALIGAARYLRERARTPANEPAEPLSPAEQARLDALLDEKGSI